MIARILHQGNANDHGLQTERSNKVGSGSAKIMLRGLSLRSYMLFTGIGNGLGCAFAFADHDGLPYSYVG
jgi:hypothetical protein